MNQKHQHFAERKWPTTEGESELEEDEGASWGLENLYQREGVRATKRDNEKKEAHKKRDLDIASGYPGSGDTGSQLKIQMRR